MCTPNCNTRETVMSPTIECRKMNILKAKLDHPWCALLHFGLNQGKKKKILFMLSEYYDRQRIGNFGEGPHKQYIKKYILTI